MRRFLPLLFVAACRSQPTVVSQTTPLPNGTSRTTMSVATGERTVRNADAIKAWHAALPEDDSPLECGRAVPPRANGTVQVYATTYGPTPMRISLLLDSTRSQILSASQGRGAPLNPVINSGMSKTDTAKAVLAADSVPSTWLTIDFVRHTIAGINGNTRESPGSVIGWFDEMLEGNRVGRPLFHVRRVRDTCDPDAFERQRVAERLRADTGASQRFGIETSRTLRPLIRYGSVNSVTWKGADTARFIRAMVLWRSSREIAWESADSNSAVNRATSAARLASERAGRMFVGGFLLKQFYAAEYDSTQNRLRVLGRDFAVPSADSTLIVMVDRVDGIGGPPQIVGTASMPSLVPRSFHPSIRVRGDTTVFTLARDPLPLIVENLGDSPAVFSYLRLRPTPR